MARQVKKLHETVPAYGARRVRQEGRSRAIRGFRKNKQGKKFATLTPAEKDDLLKALAIRAGLIEPDEVPGPPDP